MDKLNNIARTGGYPWCAETAGVLNDFSKYINMMLDGLNLPAHTAVYLHGLPYISSYMYLNYAQSYGQGIVCKVTSNLGITGDDSSQLDNLVSNPGKYSLVDRSYYVDINKEGSTTEVYEQTIYVEQKEIVLASANNSGWTFYTLEDLFQKRSWQDVSYLKPGNYSNLVINPFSKIRRDRFKNTLDIQIDMTYDACSGTAAFALTDSDMGIPAGIIIPLTALTMAGANYEAIPCYFDTGNLQIRINHASATIAGTRTVIRGTVSLK